MRGSWQWLPRILLRLSLDRDNKSNRDVREKLPVNAIRRGYRYRSARWQIECSLRGYGDVGQRGTSKDPFQRQLVSSPPRRLSIIVAMVLHRVADIQGDISLTLGEFAIPWPIFASSIKKVAAVPRY